MTPLRPRGSIKHGSPGRFIEPAVLARISNLELLARTVVEGFIAGLHNSPFVGFSLDFAAHRQYTPGDDIRKIDWRVFARTDRFYVKEFEAETNANVFLALDISRSMDFGTAGVSKLDYGRFLAASLAYLSEAQRDRIGFASFDEDVVDYVPPSGRHKRIILHTLDRLEPGGIGSLARPLARLADSLRRRGLVVLISDLYEEPGSVLSAVQSLRGRGNDVIVFHILDPAELSFPFEAPTSFEDLETGERLPVTPEAMQEDYIEALEGHRGELARLMLEQQIDYVVFDISAPLDHALFEFLSRRARRLRTR